MLQNRLNRTGLNPKPLAKAAEVLLLQFAKAALQQIRIPARGLGLGFRVYSCKGLHGHVGIAFVRSVGLRQAKLNFWM